ncbi:MAG: hypothetical protein KatS3mg077_0920 [Candidatus Binatia bacterium]|nr:MAG: hypothetical protein KatS3mg077_0920 [Candidatus Binatia bacterium]
MHRRFTPDEVNDLIPTLEVVMGELLSHAHRVHREVIAVAARLGCDPRSVDSFVLMREAPNVEPSLQAIQRALHHIADLGGQVKGLDLGLVDFPGELQGEEVLLCWQYGERQVGFYHLPEEGFAGRKPLPVANGVVRVVH